MFNNNGRLTFPQPDASLLRDGADKAGRAVKQVFPLCQSPQDDNWPQVGQQVAEWLARSPNNTVWDYDYYVGLNYFVSIKYGVAGTSSNVITAPIVATYQWAKPGKPCPTKEMLFESDPDFGRSNILVVGFVDGRPTLFRYGIYDDSFKASGSRYGKPGQAYVLVDGPEGDLFIWALSIPPAKIGTSSFDLWPIPALGTSQSNHLNACVINFDRTSASNPVHK